MSQVQHDASSGPGSLVVAGGSNGTGALVASLARAHGRTVTVVDAPEHTASMRHALAGADGVVLVPARGARSVAAQARATIEACAELGARAPHLVLVSGFSVGHGLAHALNTPERLADLLAAEDLVRSSHLRYTIVRPTWLTQDPPGRYALTLTQDPWADGMLARADLARVCLAAIDDPASSAKTFAVFAQPGPGSTCRPTFAQLADDDRTRQPEQVRG
jgi:uncharacterized protein YbjT (DUF2867 family)